MIKFLTWWYLREHLDPNQNTIKLAIFFFLYAAQQIHTFDYTNFFLILLYLHYFIKNIYFFKCGDLAKHYENCASTRELHSPIEFNESSCVIWQHFKIFCSKYCESVSWIMAFWSLIGSLEISLGMKNISPRTFQLVMKIKIQSISAIAALYLLVWDNFPFFVLSAISKLRGNCVFLKSLLCIHILYEWNSFF